MINLQTTLYGAGAVVAYVGIAIAGSIYKLDPGLIQTLAGGAAISLLTLGHVNAADAANVKEISNKLEKVIEPQVKALVEGHSANVNVINDLAQALGVAVPDVVNIPNTTVKIESENLVLPKPTAAPKADPKA